jgi:folate-binding protein YgfZ
VDALLRVTRIAEEQWALDTDAGWGDSVLSRLTRFRLRTKVELERADAAVLAVRGDGAEDAAGRLAGVAMSPPWPGVRGADVLVGGNRPDVAGAVEIGPEELEAERIMAGIPKMGAELDERTIPAETGLVPITVSFTKGCYTGQELVARIDSRGSNVPRRLRGLRFDAGAAVEPGAELVGPDGTTAGTVTSAARSERHGGVGLGYVRRGVGPADTLSVRVGGEDPGVAVTQVEWAL